MNSYPAARKGLQRITANSLATTQALYRSLAASGILNATADEQRTIAFQIVFTETCWFMFAKLAPGEVADPTPAAPRTTYGRY